MRASESFCPYGTSSPALLQPVREAIVSVKCQLTPTQASPQGRESVADDELMWLIEPAET